MRTLVILAASVLALLAAAPARAGSTVSSNSQSGSSSQSSSQSGAVAIGGAGGSSNASATGGLATGGNSSIVFNNPGETRSTNTTNLRTSGTTTVKNVPNAFAPGLAAAGIESCNSSMSGGASAVGWGISLGGPVEDKGCSARLFSRTLFAMGYKEAALQLLINESPMVQRAFGVGANGAAVTPRGLVYGGGGARVAGGGECGRWSGGATGVGSCLWYR